MVVSKPDFSNIQDCIDDSKKGAILTELGPEDPTKFNELLSRLEASKKKVAPLYRETVFKPFVHTLNELGESGFLEILLRDPQREGEAGLALDIAHAILQNGEGFQEIPTDAFQEVVSDLYDGFLSAEDRRGIKPPDKGVIPPLVKWGNPSFGPYTWPVDNTLSFKAHNNEVGVQAGIVNLPPANATQGLMAWAALGHEVGGHDIIHADTGLSEELSRTVKKALVEQNIQQGLPNYWSERIDETASDVLGILNMGPAAAAGIIAYFRALNAAWVPGGTPKLRNDGPADDPHPADILRGYLGASVVELLSFAGASAWSKALESETDKDLSTIRILGTQITPATAKKSAKIVASSIATAKLARLDNHAFIEIQDWRDEDEDIVNKLIPILTTASSLPSQFGGGIYAAHAVAAAVVAALSKNAHVPTIFTKMRNVLKVMHNSNPSWGPLFVNHPGDVARHPLYVPQT